jgi:hypothetical protein
MKLRLLIILFLFFNVCYSQNIIPNSSIFGIGKAKNDVFFTTSLDLKNPYTGYGVNYYRNTNLILDKFLYEKGVLIKKESFYKSGKILSLTEYGNNQFNGNFKYYYENGNERINGYYNNGFKEGMWIWKNYIGDTIKIELYSKGRLLKREIYNNYENSVIDLVSDLNYLCEFRNKPIPPYDIYFLDDKRFILKIYEEFHILNKHSSIVKNSKIINNKESYNIGCGDVDFSKRLTELLK